ncbi:MAG TPA: hypothetical protein VLX92_08840 [Kofleriaceae bacterium]|nr:hypothetical protein [Kofleriaceae bacterium]
MRMVLLVVLVGCAAPSSEPLPDASPVCIDSALNIEAPRADLHYATDVAVVVDVTEPQPNVALTMVDDTGASYAFDHFIPGTEPDGAIYLATWRYTLAAGHRYDLTVTSCCDAVCSTTHDPHEVVFFTSAE